MEFQTLTLKFQTLDASFRMSQNQSLASKYDCSKWLYTFIRFFLSCAMADSCTGWKLARSTAYFVDRFKQTERIHILADWIKVVAFAFAFLQCCLCCRPAGLFPDTKESFSGPRELFHSGKTTAVQKKTFIFFLATRAGKRHFGVEKKSSPLQALAQAARITLHEQLRAPLELQGGSARNLALC